MRQDAAPERATTEVPDRRVGRLLIGLAAIAIVVVTLGHDLRVQDVDPQFVRNLVERTDEFGGTFYENGIHNKGPLEPGVHWVASLVTTDAGYWFAIAGIAGLVSLLIATAGARTAALVGATRTTAAAVAVAVFVAFTFSDADYAGVIFVRNLTVALLVCAWLILIWEDAWSTPRRRIIATIGMTALIGLATQTLLTTAVAGAVLLWAAWMLLRERAESWERIKLAGIGFFSLDIAGLSAPVWYWARGAFDEFWASWWIHASYMSSATQRSLPSQLWLGLERFLTYHRERPLMAAVVVAFGVVLASRWQHWTPTTRVIAVAAAGWWSAGWLELVLSQRYTSHYFSVVAVPIAIMAALLVGWAIALLREHGFTPWSGVWVVLATLVLAVYVAGPHHLTDAARRAAAFRGPAERIAEVDRNQGGETRTVRAVLDLVSEPGDPVLGWVADAWPYQSLDRVSATRFLWRSFFIGEIYLAATDPVYVLPRTWEWFEEDIAESDPVALIEERDQIAPGTPFADLADSSFAEVMPGELIDLWLRNDVLAALSTSIHPGATDTVVPEGSLAPDRGRFEVGTTCERFDGSLTWPADESPTLVFFFEAAADDHETLVIRLESSSAVSGSEVVDYLSREFDPNPTTKVSLVIGARAAALFVDGLVQAAVRLPVPVTVEAEVRNGSVAIEDAGRGPAPAEAGC